MIFRTTLGKLGRNGSICKKRLLRLENLSNCPSITPALMSSRSLDPNRKTPYLDAFPVLFCSNW